jgi:transposase
VHMDLTDDHWNMLKDLIPEKVQAGAGRPPQSSRKILNGIFWKLRTGASWLDLPLEYSSHQTCYRYYAAWIRSGLLDTLVDALMEHLKQSGFDLFMALETNEIEFVQIAGKTHAFFAPRWRDTWQASTALLLMQIIILKKRKQGRRIPKLDISDPLALV